MGKSIEIMTLEELNLYSAQLTDELYALKNKLQVVQQWRTKRGTEADAVRHITEAHQQIEDAQKVLRANMITLSPAVDKEEGSQAKLETKPPPMVIQPASIESDEAMVGTGGALKRLWRNIVRVVVVK